MASVTQCDVCSNVVKHEQSKYIEIYSVNSVGNLGKRIHTAEICADCYTKLCTLLKLKEVK